MDLNRLVQSKTVFSSPTVYLVERTISALFDFDTPMRSRLEGLNAIVNAYLARFDTQGDPSPRVLENWKPPRIRFQKRHRARRILLKLIFCVVDGLP
jgi:hypothetical protein